MSNAVARHLHQQRTDVVICDDIYTIHNIPPCQVPVLLNKHDITHVIVRRYLRHQRNPLVKAYGWTEYAKLKRWELAACRTATAVIACSEVDRKILQDRCPGLRVVVAPNIIDTDHYSFSQQGDSRTVLYVGAMDWYPNQDAVEFFARRVLPSLRRCLRGIRFVIAGRNPPDSFRRKFDDAGDVFFTGSVADIRAEIAKATVCVVPLRIGSGTRLKILEAAAMGKAVVSTTLGAEGLDFVPNEEIVLADEPTDFTRAVAALLSDATRRSALGMAARARVQARYSLPVLQRSLRDAFLELVDTPRVFPRN
jgi:glycosyltransferase involved in cell wall biosynthesis